MTLIEPLEARLHLSTDGALGTAAVPGSSTGVELIHTVARLYPRREALVAVTVGNIAVFSNGVSGTGTSFTSAGNIYNARTGQWLNTRLPNANPQSGAAAGPDAIFYSTDQLSTPTVAVYDTQSQTWSTLQGPAGLGALQFGMGNSIYFWGDRSGGSFDIYDVGTGHWSSAPGRLRYGVTGGPFLAVVAGNAYFQLFKGDNAPNEPVLGIYNTETGRWLYRPWPGRGAAAFHQAQTTVGPLLICAVRGQLNIFNTLSRTWSTVSLPEGHLPILSSATSVGNEALFGGYNYNGTVFVYNAATGTIATTSLSSRKDDLNAATTVGSQAIFAGGATATYQKSAAIDIFTDTACTPVLTGRVQRSGDGRSASITLYNTGDARLSGSSVVSLYATSSGKLDGAAVKLGELPLGAPLAPGGSTSMTVPIGLPPSLKPGRYILLAAAGTPHRLQAFATEFPAFGVDGASSIPSAPSASNPDVGPHAAESARMALNTNSLFSTTPIAGDAFLIGDDMLLR